MTLIFDTPAYRKLVILLWYYVHAEEVMYVNNMQEAEGLVTLLTEQDKSELESLPTLNLPRNFSYGYTLNRLVSFTKIKHSTLHAALLDAINYEQLRIRKCLGRGT